MKKKNDGDDKCGWLKSIFRRDKSADGKTAAASQNISPSSGADKQADNDKTKPVEKVNSSDVMAIDSEHVADAEKVTVMERRSFDTMDAVCATNKGFLRPTNQDVYILTSSLFGIADGMGGHNGGETASSGTKIRLQAILVGKEPSPQTLEAAVKAVNRHIYAQSLEDESLSGMGTTLTLLWAGEKESYIAHVGDSRAYLFRDGALRQVTSDHSYVAEMVRKGAITSEDAKTHPMRNVITRAIGTEPGIDVDIITEKRQPGDRWLICSDGLHGALTQEKIAEIMSSGDIASCASRLMHEALAAGGRDNITMALLQDKAVKE